MKLQIKNLFNKVKQYGLVKFIQFFFNEVKLIVLNRWLLGSYSQVKEDVKIDNLTGNKSIGFYLDIGAYDPVRFSNTMRFYKKGWKGINIEPNFIQWKKFKKSRSRDINLNVGIGKSKSSLIFYSIDPSTLSTFSKLQANKYLEMGFKVLAQDRVIVQPLSAILVKYTSNITIDFMSLDVEGFEMEVLSSNNWKLHRPKILCIETNNNKNSINSYLVKNKYKLIQDNGLNSFYKDIYVQ